MVSKEEVKISLKTGLLILMTYYEECYNCRVHSLWTKLRIKIPEWVCLCEECRIEQISQHWYKEKKWTTRTAYEIWYWFLEKIYADDDIED